MVAVCTSNVSLFKGKRNAFFDPNTEMGLTETAYQFTAGVLKMHAVTAVCNPLVNSYKTFSTWL